jgi:peptidoglycan/LPS O-acetylase OafA/YrhL
MVSELTSAPQAGAPTNATPIDGRRASSALGTHVAGLDGFRGVAVVIIMAFHADLPGTQGGYLGVSQFFTLSGFLITALLLRNHLGAGRSLRSFWARRARRLMPAAYVALAGIVVFGATVATRQQLEALPGDILAAATWTANWRFVLNGQSYINLFAAPSPVQHFWSLAVEEQFYVVLPLAMLLLLRRTQSRRVIAASLALAAVASTAWMLLLYERGASIDRLYYGTDTRMAEFLTGAALAVVLMQRGATISHRLRRYIAAASVVALGLTVWAWVSVPLQDSLMWRGGLLGFSLLSCTLILAVIADAGPVASVFSFKPLVAVGVISYGLYLYHWPIFLWLTEERTGLSLWPLFALRLAVTFVAAILSYRFIEQPMIKGSSLGLHGKLRFAIAPLLAVVLVATAVFATNRSAVDPLATLNASHSLQMPREPSDGVLDLLVIPDTRTDPVMTGLQNAVRSNRSIRLTVAPPFACSGDIVSTRYGKTCGNWARSWPSLIATHNPDAILLYADDWSGIPLTRLFGKQALAQTKGAASLLAAGVSLLTSRKAPVIWATSGKSFADALRLAVNPFDEAMTQLIAERTDMHEVIGGGLPDPALVTKQQYVAQSDQVLLENASLYQREDGHSEARVFIVGDSQALSLGYGLDRWTAQNGRALVWNHGVEGCGVVTAGQTQGFGGTNPNDNRCQDAANAWPSQLKAFRPDVVIVFSSLTDIQPRKLPGAARLSSIGSADFDAFLEAQYDHVIDVLSSTGARVIWMTPPCTAIKVTAGQQNPYAVANIAHLDSVILPKVMHDRQSRVVSFDLANILCPNGRVRTSVSGVGQLRPDGVHFSVAAALWFANTYADGLLKLGGI